MKMGGTFVPPCPDWLRRRYDINPKYNKICNRKMNVRIFHFMAVLITNSLFSTARFEWLVD